MLCQLVNSQNKKKRRYITDFIMTKVILHAVGLGLVYSLLNLPVGANIGIIVAGEHSGHFPQNLLNPIKK